MINFSVPPVAKQLFVVNILHEYRNNIDAICLRNTVAQISPKTIHEEILAYVPEEGMRRLQADHIRDEDVFALPSVLKENPRLLGYHRLLLGISEKQFYSGASGLAAFASMEHNGIISESVKDELPRLCTAINESISTFLSVIGDEALSLDVHDLPLMTLGVYADGVWRNAIGRQAADKVFSAVRDILAQNGCDLTDAGGNASSFTCTCGGNEYAVFSSSDPDISIVKNTEEKTLCIEIKGGQDIANVHNRAGEAEKSHQKATKAGFKEKWTLILLNGLNEEQRKKLLTESPSTDKWFDINDVVSRTGASYKAFSESILSLCSEA